MADHDPATSQPMESVAGPIELPVEAARAGYLGGVAVGIAAAAALAQLAESIGLAWLSRYVAGWDLYMPMTVRRTSLAEAAAYHWIAPLVLVALAIAAHLLARRGRHGWALVIAAGSVATCLVSAYLFVSRLQLLLGPP